jgi:hypothetical protein
VEHGRAIQIGSASQAEAEAEDEVGAFVRMKESEAGTEVVRTGYVTAVAHLGTLGPGLVARRYVCQH